MNPEELRRKYSGEYDTLDEIIRIKDGIHLIESLTQISSAHLQKVFFTNPHHLKNGLDFDRLLEDVREYLSTHSGTLTNKNISVKGQIVLASGEIWSASDDNHLKRINHGNTSFRVSVGRRY